MELDAEGEEGEEGGGPGKVTAVKWYVLEGFKVVDEPANLDKSLIGKTVFMNWETYGWQLGKITDVVDRSTPRLFAKYNFRVVWADRSKGPAKLAVDNYGGGSTARLNSWVLLESA